MTRRAIDHPSGLPRNFDIRVFGDPDRREKSIVAASSFLARTGENAFPAGLLIRRLESHSDTLRTRC